MSNRTTLNLSQHISTLFYISDTSRDERLNQREVVSYILQLLISGDRQLKLLLEWNVGGGRHCDTTMMKISFSLNSRILRNLVEIFSVSE